MTTNTDRYRLARACKVRCEQLGLLQVQLGERCGQSQQWVSHKLSGRREITAVDLVSLAAGLETTPTALCVLAGLWESRTPRADP